MPTASYFEVPYEPGDRPHTREVSGNLSEIADQQKRQDDRAPARRQGSDLGRQAFQRGEGIELGDLEIVGGKQCRDRDAHDVLVGHGDEAVTEPLGRHPGDDDDDDIGETLEADDRALIVKADR